MRQRFDLDAIKADYDMRQVYPASPHRKDYGHYSLDVCIFHEDSKPSMLIGKDWFKCRAACPHGKGDIISWTMRSAGVSFPEACKMLVEHRAPLTISNVAYAERPKTPPPIFKRNLPDEFVDGMTDADYAHLEEVAGIKRNTAIQHQIGRYDYGIYTIPVHHPETDEVIDVKLYRPDANKAEGQLKTWHLESGAPNALYGVKYLNGDNFAVIVGGEKDTINGHEMHLPFVTDTAGEASWDEAFNRWLRTRVQVYAFLDADDTGRAGMERIKKMLRKTAKLCDWRLLWDPEVKPGYDFSDFKAEGGTREMFLEMLKMAQAGVFDDPLRPRLKKAGLLRRHYNLDEGEI